MDPLVDVCLTRLVVAYRVIAVLSLSSQSVYGRGNDKQVEETGDFQNGVVFLQLYRG